ncbi:MAG TPA: ABC transporter permease [Kiritimatiellia bacterium]|nr:ABC transporter permease [Kiritimatiellia bacterium]
MRAFTWSMVMANRLALTGGLILAFFAVAALFAPWLAPRDPYEIVPASMLATPGAEHWLGADQLGRDLFSRMMYGARISFHVGLVAVGIALTAGTLLGVAAGYLGGWVDAVISRIVDTLFSIPDILLALAVMAVLGPDLTNVMLAIGIVYTPIFARIARGSTLEVKQRLFIEAARSIGSTHATIVFRHILPAISAPLMIQASLSFAFAILAEAALSFLGFGVEPDTPSWGILLNQGKDLMDRAWWLAVFPGLAITLAVFSFNVVGDGLRDALDPRVVKGT